MHKRGLSALLSVVMTMSFLPALPASALENDEPFPYTLFAGSDEDGAIAINADNVCLNGSVVTNGSIETTATNFNINGQRIEHAQQPMVYAFGKLDDAYFDSDNVLTYESDYTVEDINISLNTPIVSTGNISLNGNINLNTQLKAEEDILVSGGSCNANNAALISHHGDIYIESTNFGFAGLIYAPYGDIVIDSSSLNLNNVVVIGQTITIDTPSLNVNHNASAANVIGTISEDPDDHHDDADNYFYAVGAYNAETSMIDIAWSGSDVPTTVDVLTSTDGETYSVVAAVTDATTYAYPVGNDFVSTYFKVSYTDANGDTVESIPFQAIVTEDGITIDFPDSDGDGIVDLLEAILGTDPNKIDTDDDGLTDYQELNITGTDPTDYDSVEKRIADADADSDGDGVSNLEEIELGTYPQVLDSDGDGLTDGEEVNTYLTDPLLEDTDGDSLTDGFEVRYGLDPLSTYTNGISDAERKIEQTISSDSPVLSEVNTSDSPYEMSVSITTNGDAERGLDVAESGYSVSLENDAQIGGITDLNLSDSCDPDSIRLTYAIKDAYRSNTLNKYSEFEDLQGIKRLCVFKYFDEISMMLPLDTQYDLENNTLYADVNDGGTYCVMDLEVWFDLFDLELDEIQIPVEVSEPQSNPPRQYLPRASADPVNKAPLDLVFILQTAGPVHMGNIYSDELSLMEEVSEFALTQYTDVRIYVIDYKYDSANIIKFGSRDYCTNVSALTNKIRNLEYTALNINDYCDTRIPFNLLKTELKLRKGVNSYIYHLHNGSNRFWTPTEDGISICNSDLGIFSQIVQVNTVYSSEEYKQALAAAIQENHGLNIEYDGTTVSIIMNHIRNNIDLSKTRTEYDALIATSLTKITLDDKLSPNNHVDTDEDTIYDWDEADNRYITVNADGSVSLPTIQNLLSHIDIEGILNSAGTSGAARNAMFKAIRNREVLPCKSDLTLKDSDGDGFPDKYCEATKDVSEYAFGDPRPLISDVTKHKIDKDVSYLSIIYDKPDNELYYGSNQGWFNNVELRFSNNTISNGFAAAEGCGLIATGDLIAYLSLYSNLNTKRYVEDKVVAFHATKSGMWNIYDCFGANNQNDFINGIQYTLYMHLLSNKVIIHPSTHVVAGTWPVSILGAEGSMEDTLNEMFDYCGSNYKATWLKQNNYSQIKPKIIEMLSNNIPVITSYDNTLHGRRLTLYKAYDNIDDGVYYYNQGISSHYVNITALIEYSDFVKNYTCHKTIAQISTWGQKQFFDFDEYINLVNGTLIPNDDSNTYLPYLLSNFTSSIMYIGVKS